MTLADKMALVSTVAALVGAVAAWLVVPGFKDWVKNHRAAAILVIGLLVCGTIALLVIAPEQAVPVGQTNQTSRGLQSPNISGVGGDVIVQYGTSPGSSKKAPGKKP
jgi:predicted PurR-regulated permease PerM